MSESRWRPPENYYETIAQKRLNPYMHTAGTLLTKSLLFFRHGSVIVDAPDSIQDLQTNVIVAITHRSALDIPVYVHATEKAGIHHTRPVAKDSLFRHAPQRWLFHQLGAFAVDRDVPNHEGIAHVQLTMLERGENLAVFAEGTRIHKDIRTVSKLKRGVAQIASLSGVPVVPLAIAGVATEKDMNGDELERDVCAPFGLRGRVVASFGDPIDVPPFEGLERRASLAASRRYSEDIRSALQAQLDNAYAIRDAQR